MLDLPKQSGIVGGLEFWKPAGRLVHEERLQAKVCALLKRPYLELRAPPTEDLNDADPFAGVRVWRFPQWFVASYERHFGEKEQWRTRPLVHWRQLVRGRYIADNKKPFSVVPIRFVQACINGHLSDINWREFVHQGGQPCQMPLWLDERGTSGDFAEIFVRCECKQSRSLATALPSEDLKHPLGLCNGDRPWLGPNSNEKCRGPDSGPHANRLLIRSATNAYFAQTLSVIHIPDADDGLRKAVDQVWEDSLQYVEKKEQLKYELKKAKVHALLENIPADKVWSEIQRRKSGNAATEKSIKELELETFLSQPEELGQDVPSLDFFARSLPLSGFRDPIMKTVERLVLVHRLREVVTQVGFTRYESIGTDIDGELSLDVRVADLADDLKWVPTVENFGEGFFLAFKRDLVDQWAERAAVKERTEQLAAGFDVWKKRHPGSKVTFPGPRYVMLHSLSHMLMTAVALECGYGQSAIRERIYVGDAGYGLLILTGGSGAEGTLGGLVQAGRRVDRHLRAALEHGKLCSNDPVCAQHRPDDVFEERFLHGAACHGCMFIAEPSCERFNSYLDRALVVPTVDGADMAFFAERE